MNPSLKNSFLFLVLVSATCSGQNIDSLVNLRVEWGDNGDKKTMK